MSYRTSRDEFVKHRHHYRYRQGIMFKRNILAVLFCGVASATQTGTVLARDNTDNLHQYRPYEIPAYTGASNTAYRFRMSLGRAVSMMYPAPKWDVVMAPTLPGDQIIEWYQGRHEIPAEALSRQNNIVVVANTETGIVGVAKEKEIATILASGDGSAWFVEAPSTMRKVVEGWVRQAGYNGLDWLPSQDYEILYPAVIVGDLPTAVTKLLQSVAGERLPLQAVEKGNKVLQVRQGGWQAP